MGKCVCHDQWRQSYDGITVTGHILGQAQATVTGPVSSWGVRYNGSASTAFTRLGRPILEDTSEAVDKVLDIWHGAKAFALAYILARGQRSGV